MPIKAVKQDLADAINNVTALLKRDYGCDFAYSILGNGMVLAQSNIYGVNQPVPLIESVVDKPSKEITRLNVTTKAGDTLQLFYNPENSLVVVDLVAANEKGGNELLRKTLTEKKLLAHAK
jgi:hypothetical protein